MMGKPHKCDECGKRFKTSGGRDHHYFDVHQQLQTGQKMSFKDAMDLVDDDLPDGAFFAMAHEIAGLEYGDGFDELG